MSGVFGSAWNSRWREPAVAIAGSLLSISLLAFLLLPSLTSVAAVEVVEDPQTFEIGTVAEIETGEGWSVQPSSREGLLVKSPDRVLAVTLRPAGPDDQLEGQTLAETLSNGAELSHVTIDGDMTALLWLPEGGEAILVEASVTEAADPADYRAEFAELLLHVKPAG